MTALPAAPRPRIRPTSAFWVTLALLVVGFAPLPADSWARWARQSARSLEPNRADREGNEAGYYEGLISGGRDGRHDELALCLLGKPHHWVDFHDIGATRYTKGDVLGFDLYPNLRRTAFGLPFETNNQGLRDREYATPKPPGIFRVAVLGASIDMGWGVALDSTYENRLEDWLNKHAERRGLERRFEVVNFSMAAYSPLQRLEAFRRKAKTMQPDLVLYSGTMLDPRLAEIHLCTLLADRVDLCASGYPEIDAVLQQIGLTPDLLTAGADGQLANKARVKELVRDNFEALTGATLSSLAAECRSLGIPLEVVLIPRAGESDAPDDRAPLVRLYTSLSHANGLDVVDLTAAFDQVDPSEVSLAPWDDHPNAQGHKLLFRALATEIVADPSLYRRLFGVAPLPAQAQDDGEDDDPTTDLLRSRPS
jgi:hypothetical protein